MKILTLHDLTKLPTPRLLSLYRKITKQFESSYHHMLKGEIIKDSDSVEQCLELDTYCRKMKSILETRGDIS
jgi:hypothetical protein